MSHTCDSYCISDNREVEVTSTLVAWKRNYKFFLHLVCKSAHKLKETTVPVPILPSCGYYLQKASANKSSVRACIIKHYKH